MRLLMQKQATLRGRPHLQAGGALVLLIAAGVLRLTAHIAPRALQGAFRGAMKVGFTSPCPLQAAGTVPQEDNTTCTKRRPP